jgi:hypothetical protein
MFYSHDKYIYHIYLKTNSLQDIFTAYLRVPRIYQYFRFCGKGRLGYIGISLQKSRYTVPLHKGI